MLPPTRSPAADRGGLVFDAGIPVRFESAGALQCAAALNDSGLGQRS